MVHNGDLRHLVRCREQVIHEGAGQELSVFRKRKLLHEGRTQSVRHTAVGHAVHHIGGNHHPAVVSHHIAVDMHLASARVNACQNHVRLKGVTRVHLHPTVARGELTTGGHFPDKFLLQSRLHARGQAVVFAVGNFHQRVPCHLMFGLAQLIHAPVAVAQFLFGDLQVVSSNQPQFVANFLGRARCCATEHDGHA